MIFFESKSKLGFLEGVNLLYQGTAKEEPKTPYRLIFFTSYSFCFVLKLHLSQKNMNYLQRAFFRSRLLPLIDDDDLKVEILLIKYFPPPALGPQKYKLILHFICCIKAFLFLPPFCSEIIF